MPEKGFANRVLKAGSFILISHLCFKLAGLISKYIIPNYYGLTVFEVFTFVNESVLNPAFLFAEQCMAPAYLPTVARARQEKSEAEAWRFTSILFNVQVVILVGIVAFFVLYPETILNSFTKWDDAKPGSEERISLGIRMLPLIAPGLIGMSLASLTYVVLTSHKQFFAASMGDAVMKLSVVVGAGAGALLKSGDWRFVAGGAVAGGILKLAIHLLGIGFGKLRNYSLTFDLSNPYFRAFVLLVLPLLAGVIVSQGRDQVIRYVNTGQEGALGYFSLGRGIAETAQFIVPFALSIALLPFFCDISARNDNKQLGEVLTKVVRMLIWFFVPVTIILAAAALPIAIVAFSGKVLKADDLQYPAMVTRIFSLQIPFAAIEMMVMQAFFSSRRVIAPTIIGFVFSGLSAGTAYFGTHFHYVDSLGGTLMLVAISLVTARILKSVVLVAMLKTSVPVLPLAETAVFIGRLLVPALAACAAAYAVQSRLGGSRGAQAAQVFLTSGAVAVAYLGASMAMRMEEPEQCWQWAKEKLKRRGRKDVPPMNSAE